MSYYGDQDRGGGYGGGGGYYGGGGGHGMGGRYGGSSSALGANLRTINWDDVKKVATEWNFYKPQQQRSEAEIAQWMRENSITIYGERVPQPMLVFSDLVAPDAIHQCFVDAGYTTPTPIQSVAWPILLNSRDIVGVAKTGSGKTMAFMIPAALHIMAQPPLQPGDGPIALVLAPTRELALQIEQETRKALSRVPSIITTCVYGGTPKNTQHRALRAGVHVCIATPGRLIDLLEMQSTNLLRVTYLVLDEADRMLDMGFEDQIRKICSQIRTDRQTLMFSATWPREIRDLAATFQRDFIRVHVGSEELLANSDVRQHVIVVGEYDKDQKLEEVLRAVGARRTLIFMKTKRSADMLYTRLRNVVRQTVLVIHGDKEQANRDYVIQRFRNDDHAILVATDVAARGLDIKNLDVVINHDLPTNIEDYVHRIGRTGRAGKTGDAYTFVSNMDPPKTLRDLVDLMTRANQTVPPELHALCSGGGGGYGGGRRAGGGYGGGRGGYGGGGGYGGYRGGYGGGGGGGYGAGGSSSGGGYAGSGGYGGGYVGASPYTGGGASGYRAYGNYGSGSGDAPYASQATGAAPTSTAATAYYGGAGGSSSSGSGGGVAPPAPLSAASVHPMRSHVPGGYAAQSSPPASGSGGSSSAADARPMPPAQARHESFSPY